MRSTPTHNYIVFSHLWPWLTSSYSNMIRKTKVTVNILKGKGSHFLILLCTYLLWYQLLACRAFPVFSISQLLPVKLAKTNHTPNTPLFPVFPLNVLNEKHQRSMQIEYINQIISGPMAQLTSWSAHDEENLLLLEIYALTLSLQLLHSKHGCH